MLYILIHKINVLGFILGMISIRNISLQSSIWGNSSVGEKKPHRVFHKHEFCCVTLLGWFCFGRLFVSILRKKVLHLAVFQHGSCNIHIYATYDYMDRKERSQNGVSQCPEPSNPLDTSNHLSRRTAWCPPASFLPSRQAGGLLKTWTQNDP